jgi:hypothetical protein
VSSQAIEIRPTEAIYQWKSPTAIKQRIIAIQQLMEEVLKPGTKNNEFSGDYGIIPGTGNKPSLWKSGSEQILAMFEISVEPVVEDLSTEDCFRYRVTAHLRHAPSEKFLGAGVGEASTNETKYKWRKTFSQKEFEATDPDRRRKKYSQYRDANGMWADKEEMQVRQEPADMANTVLKMAKKRAQIDATLTVTGASSMFSQDLDQLLDEDAYEPEIKKKASKPQAGVKCSECNAEGGHLPSCSKRKQDKPAEVKKASEVKKPEEQKPAPKSDGPVICSECRGQITYDPITLGMNGHKADCKFAGKAHQAKQEAAEPKKETEKPVLFKIVSVAQKLKKPTEAQKKKNVSGDPFFVVEALALDGTSGKIYVFDTKFFDHLAGKKDVMLVCEVSKNETADGKVFFSLKHIFELDSQKFVDDAPIKAAAEAEDLFGGDEP